MDATTRAAHFILDPDARRNDSFPAPRGSPGPNLPRNDTAMLGRRVGGRVDVLTHGLVPYAAALAAAGLWRKGVVPARHRVAWAAVFGIAGASPDLDGLLDMLSERSDALYFLQHRGVSHTAWGAPLFALATLGVLVGLARLFPRRFGLFAWRPALLAAAVLGSLTHLALDALTFTGVPLFWPFSWTRVSLQLYHWLVWWMFPIGALALALHLWGRFDARAMTRVGALLVAILVVIGGVRLATRPDVDGALVFPRADERAWTVLVPVDGGWEATTWRGDERLDRMTFLGNIEPGGDEAVARALAHPAWLGLKMESFGPIVTTATRAGDAWNVTLVDVAARYEALTGAQWTPTTPDTTAWGEVQMLVRDDGITVVKRGW